MLAEKELSPLMHFIDADAKTINISKQTAILRDDVEIAREVNAMTFSVGQLDEMKRFLGVDSSPEIDYAKQLWSAS